MIFRSLHTMAAAAGNTRPPPPPDDDNGFFSRRSRRQLTLFLAGASFSLLSATITRRAVLRRTRWARPLFFHSNQAPPPPERQVNGALEALEALGVATVTAVSWTAMLTGGLLWALDVDGKLVELRARVRGRLGLPDGVQDEAQREVDALVEAVKPWGRKRSAPESGGAEPPSGAGGERGSAGRGRGRVDVRPWALPMRRSGVDVLEMGTCPHNRSQLWRCLVVNRAVRRHSIQGSNFLLRHTNHGNLMARPFIASSPSSVRPGPLPFPVRLPRAAAVREHLVLPDLGAALDLLERLLAGAPGGAPVRARHGDEHALLADGHVAEPVRDDNGRERVPALGGGGYGGEGAQRERRVGRVGEPEHAAAVEAVARGAFESWRGPGRAAGAGLPMKVTTAPASSRLTRSVRARMSSGKCESWTWTPSSVTGGCGSAMGRSIGNWLAVCFVGCQAGTVAIEIGFRFCITSHGQTGNG